MRVFSWLSGAPIRPQHDLRQLGWRLHEVVGAWTSGNFVQGGRTTCGLARPLLVYYPDLSLGLWLRLASSGWFLRRTTMMLGVESSAERARLLRLGFGDAMGPRGSLHEIEARTLRLHDQATALPRDRTIGALRLDLLVRDALVAGRRVGLHPREFELLWRLAETPDVPVSQAELLADVWQLAFRPETNTLAVHVSRLRAKLRLAGLDGLIRTGPDGSYCIVQDRTVAGSALQPAMPLGQFGLDDYVRLGKERSRDRMLADTTAEQEDNDHAA